MFARPTDVTDADVVQCLFEGWGIAAADVTYAPVGFGSYHWHVRSDTATWFVSVDDLDARRRDRSQTRQDVSDRLSAALTAARSLRNGGLEFVVAPELSPSGTVLQRLNNRFVAAVYPHVVGEAHPWGKYPTHADRVGTVHLLAALLAFDPARAGSALLDDFVIPGLDDLLLILDEQSGVVWGPGPFANGARELLRLHHDALRVVLTRYFALQEQVAASPRPLVITHGEPHRGNIIDAPAGRRLIDWDTALLAPPERDLWILAEEDPSITGEYESRTGCVVDQLAIRLYHLWWDLCEISLFVADLHRPHERNADTSTSWEKLSFYLDRSRWDAEMRQGI